MADQPETMRTDMQRYAMINQAFETHGLALRGGLSASYGRSLPAIDADKPAQCLLLVGNLGRDMWPHFMAARRAKPALSLDGWTRQVTEPIAREFGARAVFVFDGPPFHPFQQWAQAAEGLGKAPNSMLIHPEYGLWQAYRAALLLPEAIELPEAASAAHPCDKCRGKPCITACPTAAVTTDGFQFERCLDNFRQDEHTACFGGCSARLACPIGKEHAYPPEQRQFHMRQFVERHVAGISA